MLRLLAMLAATGAGHGLACASDTADTAGTAQMRAHELSLSSGPLGDYAAWHGGHGSGSTIYVQALDERHQLTGAPFAVSDGQRLAYEPDLIEAGGQLIVAWYEKDKSTGALSAWLAAVDPSGKRLWAAPLRSGEHSSRNPVVREVGGQLHVAWIEQQTPPAGGNDAAVWHQRFSLAGRPAGEPRQIGRANRDTWNLNAATVANQMFVVTYDAALGSKAHELHMLAVCPDHVVHQRLSPDDGHASLYPDLQVSAAGQAAVTWFDEMHGNREIYLLTGKFEWLAKGIVPAPVRVTVNDGESIGAYLAWNGDRIGLVWSNETGSTSQIFAQGFTEHGRALDEARQLSATSDTASVPAIRARRAGFLVAWNDYAIEGTGAHMNVISSIARIAAISAGTPRDASPPAGQ